MKYFLAIFLVSFVCSASPISCYNVIVDPQRLLGAGKDMNQMSKDFFYSKHHDRAVPFDMDRSDYFPLFQHELKNANAVFDAIEKRTDGTFEETILALEDTSDRVSQVYSAISAIKSADGDNVIRDSHLNAKILLQEYGNRVYQSRPLYAIVERLLKTVTDKEQKRLLTRMKREFVRNGIELTDAQKIRYKEIASEMAKLTSDFEKNLLTAYEKAVVWVKDVAQLDGIPADIIAGAKEKAKELKRPNEYAVSVAREVYIQVLDYAHNRGLRQQLAELVGKIGTESETDNQPLVRKIVQLRAEKALLLGYKSHAAYVLENRMAKNIETAEGFIRDTATKVLPQAKRDIEELRALQKELTGTNDVKSWDINYLIERMAERKLGFNENEVRPFLEQNRVVEGAFDAAQRLYKTTFKLRTDLPVYTAGVKTYEVFKEGKSIGLLYLDLAYRKTKAEGAWMNAFRESGYFEGQKDKPHVTVVMGVPQVEGGPTLFTLDQATTVFHEMGHALHGLLTNVKYKSNGQGSVAWDNIELPSQFMEDWLLNRDVFFKLAKDEKGNSPSEELYQKILKKKTFMRANFMLRQLQFGLVDFALYKDPNVDLSDLGKFETTVLSEFESVPRAGLRIPSFSHIISGGYSNAYYSYMWADRSVADAHEYFAEEGGGIVGWLAEKFEQTVMSQGDLFDADELYRMFRGRDPSNEALLRRYGIEIR